MVLRYAHLPHIHLQEHAKNIDDILNLNGTNMARKIILKITITRNTLKTLVGCVGIEPTTE